MSADIKVTANSNSAGISQKSYIGLSGTGAVEFSGDIILENSSNVNIHVAAVHLSAEAGGVSTFSGVIQEQYGPTDKYATVVIDGGGKVVLTGDNTYAGGTTVSNSSTLLVNNTSGSGTGFGALTVESGSTLGGFGTIATVGANAVTAESGSVIAPGASIGTLVFDGGATTGTVLAADSGSVFNFELDASGGTPDQIHFLNYEFGDLVLADNTINVSLSGSESAGEYTVSLFKFFSDSGSTMVGSGLTSGLVLNLGEGIDSGLLDFNSGTGSIDLTYTIVPEPSMFALVCGVFSATLLMRRRR
ncbi:PEP-CTERM sorting domain-containing protein [Coraliomargarita algicola]|uniref:PEP-CTERM sorting domain-containing protein n=1 Tax=Coraliomargarita algicola TaxID=3092156 RepID=A0ABZ0RL32_9BACT|nr:PEP-CTERM sorting domain-containing protein [Coraliomargarita sp. J2-16]WPJ96926.1 PEP-CTERM sorting domain-containing protein [Coraliomargarita sp. J2-16]